MGVNGPACSIRGRQHYTHSLLFLRPCIHCVCVCMRVCESVSVHAYVWLRSLVYSERYIHQLAIMTTVKKSVFYAESFE